MPEFSPKRAIQILCSTGDYKKDCEVTSSDLWDIVDNDSHQSQDKPRVLVANVFGTKDVVTRLAQEAYGLEEGGSFFARWKVVPSKIKVTKAVSAADILRDSNIEQKALPYGYDKE